MKFNILSLSLLLFTSHFLEAQVQHAPNLFYGRYEGDVNTSTSVTANLIRTNDQVSGNYQITSSTGLNNDRKKVITGSVAGDSVYLKEFSQKDAIIKGTLTTSQIKGYWTLKNEQNIPLRLEASYPIGSLPFDVSYLKSEMKLAPERADTPTASIELTLVYPTPNQLNIGVLDSVKKHINTGFFGHGFGESNPDSLMILYENEYYNNYQKQNEQWLETGGHSFSWEKVLTMNIGFNSHHLLCIEFERYAYTGGAHGMSNIANQIINLENGSLLSFEQVFIAHSDSTLTKLLTEQLKNDRQILSDSSLKSVGFFVDQISPNHNIFVEKSGIGFVFNSYEIAPYSFGSTSIFLNFDQLETILNPETPIYRMAHSLN